jgi:hypothetical protein
MGLYETASDGNARSATFLPNLDQGRFQAAIKFHDCGTKLCGVSPPQTHDEEAMRDGF